MEEKVNKEVLNISDIDVLQEIKSEAEKLLTSCHQTETIIAAKATGLLQILFPVFIVIFGFIVDKISNHTIDPVVIIAISINSVIVFSCYFLSRALSLYTIAHLGAEPSRLLDPDCILGNDGDFIHLIRSRIYNLQIAIDTTSASNNIRTKYYYVGFHALFIGTASVLAISILSYLAFRCGFL